MNLKHHVDFKLNDIELFQSLIIVYSTENFHLYMRTNSDIPHTLPIIQTSPSHIFLVQLLVVVSYLALSVL